MEKSSGKKNYIVPHFKMAVIKNKGNLPRKIIPS
jgi:hypothetical protein